MNRAGRLAINVVVFAAGAIVALAAQVPTSNMQTNSLPTSQMPAAPMSVKDMTTHMKETNEHIQVVSRSMQSNIQAQLLMDRMKSLGADLTQLLNRIQVLMSDKTLSQDQLKMQRAQNVSRHVQSMIQSVDGVVYEMEQMQQNK